MGNISILYCVGDENCSNFVYCIRNRIYSSASVAQSTYNKTNYMPRVITNAKGRAIVNKIKFGTGANKSKHDARTVSHTDYAMISEPLISGGTDTLPEMIEHQHKVGICTAISCVQLQQKITGKKYSPDFHYLLQKLIYDKNWAEGSSILSSLKVSKNYGFLPRELFTYITEADRLLPYTKYIAKLKAIPTDEINRLISLCVDKIPGYAKVNEKDPQAIARAVEDSPNKAGILCRYEIDKNWWTSSSGEVSWLAKDINPLRPPVRATSGHAIILDKYDYSSGSMQELANTWGVGWCLLGCADTDWDNYKMTEAWVFLTVVPEIKYKFLKTLKMYSRGQDVVELQKRLGIKQTGFFFTKTKKAVMEFQKKNGLVPDGIVGKYTREKLNN